MPRDVTRVVLSNQHQRGKRLCGARLSWLASSWGSSRLGRPSRRPRGLTRSARSTSSRRGYIVGNINGQTGLDEARPAMTSRRRASRLPGRVPATASARRRCACRTPSPAAASATRRSRRGLASPAGEAPSKKHFSASFWIGTALATSSPDCTFGQPRQRSGGRMSYLRFEDQADGVHVFFDDVTESGPGRHGGDLQRDRHRHAQPRRGPTRSGSRSLQARPGNDVVKIYIDGNEGDHRHDVGGLLPLRPGADRDRQHRPADQQAALPRGRGRAPANAGKGFLVDSVSLDSDLTQPSDHFCEAPPCVGPRLFPCD